MADLKRRLFGYSPAGVRSALSEREAELGRASENASAAEQRGERLSSELAETQGRLAGLEEQLDAAQELSASLTADLERSNAERGSIEAEVLPLRRELEDVRTELRDAREAILGREEQLRVAEAGSAELEDRLREQTEHLERATAEAAESRAALRALDDSGGFEAAMSAQAKRVAELEELVEGYRELVEGGSPPAVEPAGPSPAQEPTAAPSTAGELAAVIEVAEQAVTSILESTRARADEELRTVDGERERIMRDVEAITAWRDRAAPMIVSLQVAMREMQGQAEEIGHRVDEALRPVSTAVTALTRRLASLDGLGAPLNGSRKTPTPSRPDRVTELPEEHLASRDSSDS
jgi:chromosome segregation ATPase